MPEVSVIISVYNGEKYLKEALESVFAQTFRDFELIVVNDGSTDGTEECLSAYREHIVYIRQVNRGLAASRGVGLQEAKGSLVAFLDADDIWLPEKLERQVDFARRHPEYGIVTTDALCFMEERIIVRSLKESYKPSSGNILEKLLFGNWIPPSAALIRRECFQKVTTFDVPPPGYGEDWLMWMQIAAYYPIHFIDEVLVRRRLHPESMSSHGGEVQFRCLFRNLEILRQRMPQFFASGQLIEEAAFRLCINRGLNDLRAIEIARAREKLKRALDYRPHSLKALLLLGVSYCPPWALGLVKKLRKTFLRTKSQSATATRGGN
jgi:Glycosyl transferase family 2